MSKPLADPPSKKINPSGVRYIKLGEAGRWEKECIEKGIIRFGFDSANAERFSLCRAGKWKELEKSFLRDGRAKGTATNFTNQTRKFFEDDGSILWITFVGVRLYWGLMTPEPPERHPDGGGVYRTVAGGWRWTDLKGDPLTKDRLSGALTKLVAYKGTSCNVDVADYVVRRVNGRRTPEEKRALLALKDMKQAARKLMSFLEPRDFEALVDLVFSTSGWRRLGSVGGMEKTHDLDMWLPSTDERAFVQIKSKATSRELAKYAGKIEEHGPYSRMFFVFHSSEVDLDDLVDDERVHIIGPEKLAEMVVDAGLVNWLIQKVA